jgi:hypothetical protein
MAEKSSNGWKSFACLAVAFLMAAAAIHAAAATYDPLAWPEITSECRPWAYNWWLGSAVDKENLGRELRRYRDGGLGGIHVIPIYGAKGAEARNHPFLGAEWMDLFSFAVAEAGKLGLGVDLTTGTGWCFGGPDIAPELAGIKVVVTNGEFQTAPAAPRVKRASPGGEGPMLNPFYGEAMSVYLRRFTAAFDASGAPRPRAMYHDSYEYSGPNWSPDFLTEFEARRGYRLQDEIPAFAGQGDTDRVERVRCDYRETLSDLMVDKVFPQWTGWCRERGMLTRNQAHGAPCNLLDFYALADIPETEMFGRGLRDPLVSRFDERFRDGDRNPLVSKLASSAAHTAGRRLTSAETGTWMAEHFCETPEELKCFVDLLLLSGVNHIFYHGCAYSPDDAAWPGWLFYASTEMNPRNPIWRVMPALNDYVARCQAVLQSGLPDNDVLLYWPIHDTWAAGAAFQFAVHHREWLEKEPVGKAARLLWDWGYGFDYVSDRLLEGLSIGKEGRIVAPGGASFSAVVVPSTRHMPDTTLARLLDFAEQGAFVIFEGGIPDDVPGLGRLEERRQRHAKESARAAVLQEKGMILCGDLIQTLERSGLRRESMVDWPGLQFVRRAHVAGQNYFIANHSAESFDDWCPLAADAASVIAMDPMTGKTGLAEFRPGPREGVEVRLRLEPGHSIIFRTLQTQKVQGPQFEPLRPGDELAPIGELWSIAFIAGGPELPRRRTLTRLASWTDFDDPQTERFGGTAVYKVTFAVPGDPAKEPACLDLGEVCHTARVSLNGRDLGTLLMHPYRIAVPGGLLKPEGNVLEIEVTNLAANRIRDLDRRKVEWRIFDDINFVNTAYKPFDASEWPPFASGLLGPVRLTSLR